MLSLDAEGWQETTSYACAIATRTTRTMFRARSEGARQPDRSATRGTDHKSAPEGKKYVLC